MIALLQRVSQARIDIDGETVGCIQRGLLVLVGIERGDDRSNADRLLSRLLGYRVFPDSEGRMNLSLTQIAGGLLLVPQFTLVADTRKGTRPSFSCAASPAQGRQLFEYLLAQAHLGYASVAAGVFGADMQVTLTNDGPVTFTLHA